MNQIAWTNVGDANTPQSIKRIRRQFMDACLRLGQSVVVRHVWNRDDVNSGLAKQCPACYNSAYDQTRGDCPVCFGVGFVSVANNTSDLYINTQGKIVTGDPGTGVLAPLWGGFDQPFLTRIIEPDVTEDIFRINEQGILVRTYDATGVAPWYPTLGDNDLCVNITVDPRTGALLTTEDRFQLKKVQQVTIRGFGNRARNVAEVQPYLVQQNYQMNKLPLDNVFYTVPVS